MAVALLACPERPSAPAAAGVRVSLPDGWVAQGMDDQGLRAGPPARPVLRIDVRRGDGPSMPDSGFMTGALYKNAGSSSVVVLERLDGADWAVVRYALVAAGASAPGLPAMVGARRLGKDLYLCATFPGASAEEVTLAAGACRDLRLSSGRATPGP